MSLDTQADAAIDRRKLASSLDERVRRSSTACRSGPDAPVADSDPTSSWSNRQTSGVTSFVGSVASNASSAHQHDTRLSRRADAMRSCAGPSSAGALMSWNIRSQLKISAACTSRCPASHCEKSPSVVGPRPQIGVRCCCLSSCRPLSFTSRSRWMASCGTRAIGSFTCTRCVSSRVTTRPDKPRSRSSHEFNNAPP